MTTIHTMTTDNNNKTMDNIPIKMQNKSRKILINLRSKKLFSLNKLTQKNQTTIPQRKLYYINRMNTIKKCNNNRYKFVRKENNNCSGSSTLTTATPTATTADIVSKNSNQGIPIKHKRSVVNKLSSATAANIKVTQSCTANKMRNFNLKVKRKYNPAKFKYVKPSD